MTQRLWIHMLFGLALQLPTTIDKLLVANLTFHRRQAQEQALASDHVWVQTTSAWQINQELGIQPFIFDGFIGRGQAHLSQHSTNTPEFPCSGCSNVEAIRLGAHLNHRSPVDWTSALLLLRKNSWDVRRRRELKVRNGWLMLLLMTSEDPKSGIPNCGDRGHINPKVQTCWRNWEELATHPGNRSSKESPCSPYHDILHARSSSTKSWDLVSAQSLASSFIDRKYATTPEPTSSTHLTAIMSNRSQQSTLQGQGIAMCRHVEFRMSTWGCLISFGGAMCGLNWSREYMQNRPKAWFGRGESRLSF